MNRPVLFALSGSEALAQPLSAALDAEVGTIEHRQFPDGETYLRVGNDVSDREVILLSSLDHPDAKLLPLLFAADTARDLGARRIGLVAPYLAYMRQDIRFHPGEAVTSRTFAAILSRHLDWLVTVDPHLHRIARLEEVFPIPAVRAVSAPLLANWIKTNLPDAVLLGPDSESQQWVAEVARLAGRPYEVLRKVRTGDRQVEVSVPESAVLRDGTPVILDDIASSGRTLVRTIERLVAAGSRAPVCLVIHAVFAGSAHDDILAAGAARIITTDTIPHPSNAIGIADVLAEAFGSLGVRAGTSID